MVEQDNQAVGVDLFEQGYLTSSQLFSLDDLSGAEAAAYLEKELFRGLSSDLEHFRSTQDPNWFFLGPSDGVAVQAMQALGLSLPKPIDHGTVIQAPEEVDVVRYHTAVGLALYGHQDEPFPMNLIPPPAAAVSEPKRLPGRAVLLGTAIIMLLGLYGANTIRHQWELRRLKENVDALRPQIEEVHRINRELNQLKAEAGAVEAMTARDPSALQMLRELTLVIPSSAWLTEAGFTGSEMIIGGYAQSSQELIGLLEESPLFANIEFRGTITKREGKERFKIAAQIE
jgi:Tfp pilus assembly protein PilN